jgi:short-subunit dehydrogenase
MQKFRDVRFEDECAGNPTQRTEVHIETNLVAEQRAVRAGRKPVIVLKPLETACDHAVPEIKGWFEVINLGDVIIPKTELHTLPADVVAGLHQAGDATFHGRHVQLTMNYFDACRERKAAGNGSVDDLAVADDEHGTELDAPERPWLYVWKDSLWVCAVPPLLGCHLHLTTKGLHMSREVQRRFQFGSASHIAVALGVGAIWACRTWWLANKRKAIRAQVVVITGGSRGLGLDIARQFGKLGARLVLAARDEHELHAAAETLVRERCAVPENIAIVVADISVQEDAERLIAEATARFGRVNILVNNAAAIYAGPALDQNLENIEHALRTNLGGTILTTRAVLPQMLACGNGRIVNISSIAGKAPIPHMLPYSISKFAIVGYSQTMRTELLGQGIRVTTVCPGLMRTGSSPFVFLTGNREKEYRWFSASESTPLWAVSSRRSAKHIVNAAATGRAELIIAPQAWIAARANALAPGLTSRIVSWINDLFLPAPNGDGEAITIRGVRQRRPL